MKLPELLREKEYLKSLPLLTIALLLIVSVSLLFLNTMLQNRDGRSTILSREGENEYISALETEEELRLRNILQCIKGVGNVEVMICSENGTREKNTSLFSTAQEASAQPVTGVIVAAEGGDDPVIQSRIIDAVSTVCSIAPSDVAVFQLNRRTD